MKKNSFRLPCGDLRRLKTIVVLVMGAWTPLCGAAEEAPAEVPAAPAEEDSGVLPPRLPEGTPSLQMSTDYSDPALGFGTYVPGAQMQGRGVRVEPFTIRAALQTGLGYNDNVLLSPDKSGSMFMTVAPSVSIGLEGATQRYYAIYRGNYGAYASGEQDNYTDHNMVLSAANAWTTRFRTLASYEYLRAHTPRGFTTTNTGSTLRWNENTLDGTVVYGATGAIGELRGNVNYASRRYTNSASASALEYDRATVRGGYSQRLAPKTRGEVQVSYGDIEHPGDATLDSTESHVQVGATWEALAKTTGRAAIGYTSKDFSSPIRADYGGVNFEVGGTWTPRSQTAVAASVSRFLTETFEVGTTFVVNTVGTATWTQLWPRSIQSTVNYVYGRIDHQGASRVDTLSGYGARVSYLFRRSLRFGAEIRHDARDSDVGGLDYSRNIFLLTAESAL
jgi:hypothetical protein